jgi:hypothetical protein
VDLTLGDSLRLTPSLLVEQIVRLFIGDQLILLASVGVSPIEPMHSRNNPIA